MVTGLFTFFAEVKIRTDATLVTDTNNRVYVASITLNCLVDIRFFSGASILFEVDKGLVKILAHCKFLEDLGRLLLNLIINETLEVLTFNSVLRALLGRVGVFGGNLLITIVIGF